MRQLRFSSTGISASSPLTMSHQNSWLGYKKVLHSQQMYAVMESICSIEATNHHISRRQAPIAHRHHHTITAPQPA